MSPFDVADGIRLAALAALDPTISRSCVVPGEVAWDDCQCGQLVISEVDRYPSSAFPIDGVEHDDACGEPWHVVQFLLSLTRCVPTVDDNGNAPSCEALSDAAHQLMKDKSDVRFAVYCYLNGKFDAGDVEAFSLGHQLTTGPQGLCAGHDLTIFVGWTNDCGC
jgi:hypothetical protein